MESATDSPVLLASDSDGANLNTPLTVTRMSGSDADRESDAPIKKQRRVRTGCFTCRDRHLKCDEALGQCQNCRKSGRICRRGVRLNFVDTQVAAPPTYIQPPAGYRVTFRDDSRAIASEYVDGIERYPPEEEPSLEVQGNQIHRAGSSEENVPIPLFKSSGPVHRHLSFDDPTKVSHMQVFVENIGPWMDVLDDMNHFTRILPFHALREPMLYAAFAACAGNSVSSSDEGMRLYSTAVRILSESIADPLRDSALCAVAAIIIEVAESLVLGPVECANRIRGESIARSLIRECQWSTHTQGLGKACSWISIVMELLNGLTFHRTLASDPDTWGVDMNLAQAHHCVNSNEELWTQRMIYICAKISDFWAVSHPQRCDQRGGDAEFNRRLQEWNLYNEWCESWINSVPKSMLPLGQLQPWQIASQPVFPQVWILGRSAVLAQLLYHVSRIMLIKANPVPFECITEMQQEDQHHAYQVCGIIANERSLGIPIFSPQLLAVAAESIIDRRAQQEVLQTLDKIMHENGLKTDQLKRRLQDTWGWGSYQGHQSVPSAANTAMVSNDLNSSHTFSEAGIQAVTTDPVLDYGDSLESHSYLDHHFTSYHGL
ncbi:Zn(II)2Cys6 transcription factor domain-containing protein [Aspergillus lucknowensis]|uniref:Zn(2)-C6 fungal-type domain-containing protein n=1 Tax=Aspergillus lucknowensis TaxID=176173 RepID=A0ABR4LD67_9EURO